MAEEKGKIILEPRRKFDYAADEKIFYDMVVLGRGVAGLACGMYAGRLGLKVLVVGELSGGTVTLTDYIENYPGFISIDGEEFGRVMENHARDYDIDVLDAKCDKVEMHNKGKKRHFVSFCEGKKFFSKTIVFATGSKIKKLGIPGEAEFEKRGVAYCALCDGPIFAGKVVGVVGGGNSAVKEALLLSNYAKKVYIIYRGKELKIEEQNRLKLEKKIKEGKVGLIGGTNVVEVKGGAMVERVVLDREYERSNEFSLDGLFIYIGHIPLSEMASSLGVKLNGRGEVLINDKSETNVAGVYAAGDLTSNEWKQAIIGVAEGVKAAYNGYHYVEDGSGVLEMDK